MHAEYLVSSGGRGCAHSPHECRQPTDLLLTACGGLRQNCSLLLPETQIVGCGFGVVADFLDYEYQCVPAAPTDAAIVYR